MISGLSVKMEFNEFNFLIFSIYKENKKIKFGIKETIKGISGYCLMNIPNDIKISEYKKFCYGGPIANFIFAIISFILLYFAGTSIIKEFLYCFGIINLGITITNLIPCELNNLNDTDGAKIYKATKDINYINNINKVETINKLLSKGVAIENIDDSLIFKPEKLEDESDFMAMSLYVSKIIGQEKYDEALVLINLLLNDKNTPNKYLINIKKSLIDIYLEKEEFDKIKEVFDIKLFNDLKILSNFVKQTNIYLYLYCLLNNDNKNTKKYYEKLNKSLPKIKKTNKNDYEVMMKFINIINKNYV